MSIELHADPRTNSVLNAALAVFARYGFKRVSMEDIAREAGLSRPLLYLSYPNKAAIFTGLARAMADRACTHCEAAWPPTATFEVGLVQAALALNLDAWRLIKGSPHGGELMADNSEVVGEISREVDRFFSNLIETRLKSGGHSAALARMILGAVHGIKDKATSEEELVAHITAFATVIAAGL
jgi:AcrR family transcriptional regulator